jgi:hypothetical protein
MAKFAEVDFKELKDLQDQIKKLIDEGDNFLKQAITNIALRAIRKIKQRTPVDTGTLRNAWRIKTVEKVGGQYVAYIVNETAYAEFVEFGHRAGLNKGSTQKRTIIFKKKKSKVKSKVGKVKVENGYVKGRFMMTISIWEIEKEMDSIVQREFEKWLKSRIEK